MALCPGLTRAFVSIFPSCVHLHPRVLTCLAAQMYWLALHRRVPAIRYQPPPSLLGLRRRVHSRMYWHLSDVLSRTVHYENNIYSALTSYLSEIFPARRGFVVAPQCLLRPIIPLPDDTDSDAPSDISFSSAGGVHIGRESSECYDSSFQT